MQGPEVECGGRDCPLGVHSDQVTRRLERRPPIQPSSLSIHSIPATATATALARAQGLREERLLYAHHIWAPRQTTH